MNTATKKINITKLVLGCLAIILLITTFIVIAQGVVENWISGIDEFFQNFVLSIRSKFLNVVFIIITNLVNPIFIGVIAFIILMFVKDLRQYGLAQFLNMGLISLLNLVLKSFFVRDRPDSAISVIFENGYSFPSGHTMMAVAFYGFLIFMAWQTNMKKGKKIGFTFAGIFTILLVSFSRIYLGVHYFSDIIGAYCVAIAYLIVFMFVVKRNTINLQTEKVDYKKHSFLAGFSYAGKGILTAFTQENNLLVQFSASMLVVVFGVTLKISMLEWCICAILCFLVMALELVNTAIENVCDKITLEQNEKIRVAKDVAAGAVLLMSICSVIVAGIIFIPKLPILFV